VRKLEGAGFMTLPQRCTTGAEFVANASPVPAEMVVATEADQVENDSAVRGLSQRSERDGESFIPEVEPAEDWLASFPFWLFDSFSRPKPFRQPACKLGRLKKRWTPVEARIV